MNFKFVNLSSYLNADLSLVTLKVESCKTYVHVL